MEPDTTGLKRKKDGTFAKGISGNPAGRPQGSVSIMTRVRQIFNDEPEAFEQYVRDVIKDPKLRQQLIEQIDGKPAQVIKGDNDSPLVVQLINYGNSTDSS